LGRLVRASESELSLPVVLCVRIAYQPKLGSKTGTGRDKRLKNSKIVTDNITDKDRNITWAWG
jgi:hypothetical protein